MHSLAVAVGPIQSNTVGQIGWPADLSLYTRDTRRNLAHREARHLICGNHVQQLVGPNAYKKLKIM